MKKQNRRCTMGGCNKACVKYWWKSTRDVRGVADKQWHPLTEQWQIHVLLWETPKIQLRPNKINFKVLRPKFLKIDEGGRLFIYLFIGEKLDEATFYIAKSLKKRWGREFFAFLNQKASWGHFFTLLKTDEGGPENRKFNFIWPNLQNFSLEII